MSLQRISTALHNWLLCSSKRQISAQPTGPTGKAIKMFWSGRLYFYYQFIYTQHSLSAIYVSSVVSSKRLCIKYQCLTVNAVSLYNLDIIKQGLFHMSLLPVSCIIRSVVLIFCMHKHLNQKFKMVSHA